MEPGGGHSPWVHKELGKTEPTNTFHADVNGNVCLHVYSGGPPPVGPLKITKFTCVRKLLPVHWHLTTEEIQQSSK